MIKKLIATMAIFSLVSISAAVPQQTLKQAINEFNFALTVEWDQTNVAVYNNAIKKFRADVAKLTAAGMSNDEILSALSESIQNEKIAADLKGMLAVVDANAMDSDEAINFVINRVQSTTTEGASYYGRRRVRNTLIAGLIVGLAVALILGLTGGDDDDDDNEVIIDDEDEGDECQTQIDPPTLSLDKTIVDGCYYLNET